MFVSAKLKLDRDLRDYHFVAQAELSIEGVNDVEEFGLTDVSLHGSGRLCGIVTLLVFTIIFRKPSIFSTSVSKKSSTAIDFVQP